MYVIGESYSFPIYKWWITKGQYGSISVMSG